MGKSKMDKRIRRLKIGSGVAVVVIVLAILFVMYGERIGLAVPVADEDLKEEVLEEVAVKLGECPADGITTLNIELEDDFASVTTMITGTNNIVFKDMTTKKIINKTASSSSSAWLTIDVDCLNRFKVYAIADSATAGSAESAEFVASGNNMYLTLHSNKLAKHTVKVKDIDGDDWEFLFADEGSINNWTGSGGSANSSTGVDMNDTSVFEDATGRGNNLTIASDGYLDMELYIKSATNRYKVNDHGMLNGDAPEDPGTRLDLKNFVCVDLGGATNGQEWDTDTIKLTFEGGDALPNVKGTLVDVDSKEYLWLQNSEACYQIGDVGDTYKTVGFYVKAKASQDPDATDDDIILYFLGEGLYASSDVSEQINTGILTDATTQAGVLFDLGAEDPYVTFEIG